jgi:aryl carrier-like protein
MAIDEKGKDFAQLQQINKQGNQYDKGNNAIHITWSKEANIQQKQLMAVMQLKTQLDQICADIGADNHIALKVSDLGLRNMAGDQLAEQMEQQAVKARPDLPTNYQAPQTELEQILAEVWAKSLGQDKVGVNDNFFDFGGDSLIASVLVNQLKYQHQIEVGLRELLAMPTIAQLSELLENRRWLEESQSDDAADDSDEQTLVL